MSRSHLPPKAVRAPVAMLLVALAIALTLAAAERPGARAAQGIDVPSGRWTTFANGDDILALELDGPVLWAGTRAGGLVRHDTSDGSAVQFLRPQDALAGNTIRDVALAADGRVWLATEGGLSVLADGETADKADDVWHTWTHESTAGALPSDDVQAVAIDGDTVWVGTAQIQDPLNGSWSGGGLARLDTRGTVDTTDDVWAAPQSYASTFKRSPTGDDKLGLVSDNINDLALNEDGDLWVATGPHWLFETQQVGQVSEQRWTRVHGGISHIATQGTFDPADDEWTASSCETMQETVTCLVHTLAIDPLGFVWAAIGGRGVMWFGATEPRIIDERSRRFSEQGEYGDPLRFVEAITFGPADDPNLKHTVWMGTREMGLVVLDHGGVLRNQNDDRWNFGRESSFGTADGLARERVQAVAVGAGKAWAGTGPTMGTAGGISPVDLVDLTVAPALRTQNAPPSNFIADLDFGAAGTRWADHVWVASGSRQQRRFGAGVAVLDTAGTAATADDAWQRYTTVGTDADGALPWTGLVGDNVHAVAVRGQQVWFGSTESTWNAEARSYSDGGLSVFDGTSWTARTVENTGGPETGLRDGSVSSLGEGCDGELWVGTGNPWDFQGAGVDVLRFGDSVHVLAQDSWTAHNFVDKNARDSLPSRNISALAADCEGRAVWAAAAHHVRLPMQGSPGGSLVGGGVARRDLDEEAWTRYDVRHGMESYHSGDDLLGEMLSVFAAQGHAWVGGYGTAETTQIELVRRKPYWPAVLNHWDGDAWQTAVFARSGRVSDVTRDQDGRIWAATSRGGMARDSARPENWRHDRGVGGLMVGDGSTFMTLTVASGLPTDDIAVVRVDPEGNLWLGSEGWGLARFEPGAGPPPTVTPTPRPRTPTPSPTTDGSEATPTPIGGSPSATPTGGTPGPGTPDGPTVTSTPRPTATPRDTGEPGPIYMPWTGKRTWPP